MNLFPTRLRRAGDDRLLIEWNTGETRSYTAYRLRIACPCALCRQQEKNEGNAGALPILTPLETTPLSIVRVNPVGRYAYEFDFGDGHQSGIYTLDYLYEIGEPVEA